MHLDRADVALRHDGSPEVVLIIGARFARDFKVVMRASDPVTMTLQAARADRLDLVGAAPVPATTPTTIELPGPLAATQLIVRAEGPSGTKIAVDVGWVPDPVLPEPDSTYSTRASKGGRR